MLYKFELGKFYKARNMDLSVNTSWIGAYLDIRYGKCVWIGGNPEHRSKDKQDKFHPNWLKNHPNIFTPSTHECEKLRMRSADDCEMVMFSMEGWGKPLYIFAIDEIEGATYTIEED